MLWDLVHLTIRVLTVSIVFLAFSAQARAQESLLERDVLPILSENCFACHGPDESQRKADLRLDTREGALRVLSLEKPAESQLLVRVRAAAVNFPDVLFIAGKYQVKIPPPFIPGNEIAGEVIAVGDGVPFSPGQRVAGTTFGAFAEQALLEQRWPGAVAGIEGTCRVVADD